MRKYRVSIVNCSQHRFGIIELIEDGLTRSLHFGSAVRQSVMGLNRPEYLALPHTMAMMSGLIFQPTPRKALLIGQGDGSLANFLFHHLPLCSIDAVEYREQVVNLAHSYFLLPVGSQLHIHIAHGNGLVQPAQIDAPNGYYLILVDAYDSAGMADDMRQTPFLDACRTLLSANGHLAINL